MLARSPKRVETEMPDADFLARLKSTAVGQSIFADRAHKVRDRRAKAAAELANASGELDAALRTVDSGLSKTQAEIEALAERLRLAHAKHRQLTQERLHTVQRSHVAVSQARAILQATAPSELVALESLARRCELSAKFHLRHKFAPGLVPMQRGGMHPEEEVEKARADFNASRQANLALLARAQKVLNEVQAMLITADPDVSAVDRLRTFLAVPQELLQAIGNEAPEQSWSESR